MNNLLATMSANGMASSGGEISAPAESKFRNTSAPEAPLPLFLVTLVSFMCFHAFRRA